MPAEAIAALRRAVTAMPTDVGLRLHLAELELGDGLTEAAITTLAEALALEPGNARVRELLDRAMATDVRMATDLSGATTSPEAPQAEPAPTTGARTGGDAEPEPTKYDWGAAEADLGSDIGPSFVNADGPDWDVYTTEKPGITLADVGGLDAVKERLNAAFLAPLQHPELRALYGKSLRGGLLLYGPPGCGKTYIARAIAGELGASFLSIGVADVLDMWLGNSERNIHELFQQARRDAPCVVFLDELDTLGQRRTAAGSAMLGVVNQLLTELDGFAADNDGVFVLAATNQPWQVDPALRRPGRFDRTLLVLPPDGPAREAIFHHNLRHRPVERIDLGELAGRTDGYTGADIAFICEAASERALLDSVRRGEARLIGMADVIAAAGDVRPSVGPWLETVRNYVQYGEDDGTFAELRAYLKRAKRL